MLWTDSKSKKRTFSSDQHTRFHTLRFRRRADLLAFAMKRPGGLAAHFLAQVRLRLGQPLPSDTAELRNTDVASWALKDGALKDVRDQKELMLLARILSELAHDRLPQLVDIIAMRVRELRAAKAEGGSWDKAGVLSLQPGPYPAAASLPDGAFSL